MRKRSNAASAAIPESAVGRASRLMLSGARIAAREVAGRIAARAADAPESSRLATRVRQTQELVQTLKELKGAAMKAGQMLGVEFSDLLPAEVTSVLRELHDSSTFMPIERVRAILAQELGVAGAARLEDLSETPIAAASIGQVHRARLDGRDVAVKIQFPGIAGSIDSDLAVLSKIARVTLTAQGRGVIDLAPVMDEISRGLKLETDYRHEANNLEQYAAGLDASRFVVPQVFRELSTTRVLTLSFESGMRIGDWLTTERSSEETAAFARLVVELTAGEFFARGLVQTDPNYGNFLYRPEERRLVLLDFGAVSSYPAPFRAAIRTLMACAVDGDAMALIEQTFALGLLDRSETPEAIAAYVELMRLVAAMFAPSDAPFSFADEAYLKAIRTAAYAFARSVKRSAPARQVIFLNRKLGGMFHLLKDAGATVDLAAFFDGVLQLDIGELQDGAVPA